MQMCARASWPKASSAFEFALSIYCTLALKINKHVTESATVPREVKTQKEFLGRISVESQDVIHSLPVGVSGELAPQVLPLSSYIWCTSRLLIQTQNSNLYYLYMICIWFLQRVLFFGGTLGRPKGW